MRADDLEPAIVHEDAPQKLSVFKLDPEAAWLVVDKPAGTVVGQADSWAEALEVAALFLRAARMPEVCS